jgi:hypothetical protein
MDIRTVQGKTRNTTSRTDRLVQTIYGYVFGILVDYDEIIELELHSHQSPPSIIPIFLMNLEEGNGGSKPAF